MHCLRRISSPHGAIVSGGFRLEKGCRFELEARLCSRAFVFVVVGGCISVGDYRGMGSQTYLPFSRESVAVTIGRSR